METLVETFTDSSLATATHLLTLFVVAPETVGAGTGSLSAGRRILSPHSPCRPDRPVHSREAPDILEFRSP